MVIMDLKGITWVGHVYQKFEDMCLEVEEIVHQDTVRYVENQMQTVGSSVKKFYSDVIEDLLSPSSLDPVKGKVSSFPQEQNSVVEICKKPKIGIMEETQKVANEKLCEDSVAIIVEKGTGQGQSFHGFHIEDTSFQACFENIAEGACFDVYAGGSHVKSGRDHSSTCMQASDDEVGPTSATTQIASFNPIEESNDELKNESKGVPGVFTSSSSAKDCDQIENPSAPSSCTRISCELSDIGTSDGVVSLVGSSLKEDVQPQEFSDKITFLCHAGISDYLTSDTIEPIVVEQGIETIHQLDNMKIEDSCVLVNGDELCFVPCRQRSHRPYKKMIQGAISSRMRSARKNEYKQLAIWYDEDAKYKQESTATKGLPSQSSCELEWELL